MIWRKKNKIEEDENQVLMIKPQLTLAWLIQTEDENHSHINCSWKQYSQYQHRCRWWDNLSTLLASARTGGTLFRFPLSPPQGRWQHQLSGGRIYPECSKKEICRNKQHFAHMLENIDLSLLRFIAYFLWLTLNRDENTWKVWTAQEPSESVTSWLMCHRQASSASSHTVGWKAAKMAEKKGEGGGGNPRSSKSSTSSRKLKFRKANQ